MGATDTRFPVLLGGQALPRRTSVGVKINRIGVRVVVDPSASTSSFVARVDGFELPIRSRGGLPCPTEITVGIRPEDWRLAVDGRVPGHLPLKKGEVVRLVPDRDKVAVFDSGSGSGVWHQSSIDVEEHRAPHGVKASGGYVLA